MIKCIIDTGFKVNVRTISSDDQWLGELADMFYVKNINKIPIRVKHVLPKDEIYINNNDIDKPCVVKSIREHGRSRLYEIILENDDKYELTGGAMFLKGGA